MRAILSVSNKRGLVEFAQGLNGLGFEMFSTGGTQRSLAEAGVPVRSVSEITGFPEILEGRVKTLHPVVHGGILARKSREDDLREIAEHGIAPIDLVCVNLYPFVEAISNPNITLPEALEQIDIGGPTMVRASAKNHPSVVVVCDPDDYGMVLDALRTGGPDAEMRRRLAAKAFQHTASYDTAIAQYLRDDSDIFPEHRTFAAGKISDLRYGENPQQRAAFYREQTPRAVGLRITEAQQLHGPELSFNNIVDADAALRAVSDFAPPTVAIIKHSNPVGVACRDTIEDAYENAYLGDTVSAFGAIVAFNRPVDMATAEAMSETFFEAVIAPGYEEDALDSLRRKRNLRILTLPDWEPVPSAVVQPGLSGLELQVAEAHARSAPIRSIMPVEFDFRKVSGGFIIQTPDLAQQNPIELRVVTEREPKFDELVDMLFSWRVVAHVKSNGIVLARNLAVVGIGAGQPNRATAVNIAVDKAADRTHGSVMAADAYFPFSDGIERAAIAGVTAIIQPGGSIRDAESIRAANRHNVAMVFTGVRHFWH